MLVIGAHPDDEDTELLTILTRGEGAEAAYLSLNRGEGGQNLVGSELGVALGILRTEELLAARRLDGAGQYFTRAYDFGFSKNLEDTWAHWPRDTVLKDVVRIVRRFRPQIIVSIFSGTPRDGHGQHQAAGWPAMEAFRVAGKGEVFPELQTVEGLAPWVPLKLYRSARFDTAATTLTLDGARIDTAVGKTFHQIAMASRSLHRSQDMGQLQTIGPECGAAGAGQGRDWTGCVRLLGRSRYDARGSPRVGRRHEDGEYRVLIDSCRANPGDSLMAAGGACFAPRSSSRPARNTLVAGSPMPELQDQLRHIGEAWQAASGTLLDVRSSTAHVAPGDSMEVGGGVAPMWTG